MISRSVKFISWNINGCSSPIKRRKIISFLKNNQADIAMIKETGNPHVRFRGREI